MEGIPSKEELLEIREHDPELYKSIVKKIREEKERYEVPSYVQALFGPQREFFEDPSKKKAAVCSRRAGKTEAVAAWLLEGARDTPGGQSVYVALSRNNCRMILWKTLQSIDRRHDLKLKFRERDNQLVVVTPNGHEVWLAGCKDTAEIEKFRGLKLRRAAIDEGASYGDYLRPLVEDVLEPALVDLDGELCIIGTPGVSPTGYFFEITTGAGQGVRSAAQWSTHSWTIQQNPHIQLHTLPKGVRDSEVARAEATYYINSRAESYLESKLEQNNWSPDHPTFRREWKGEWVLDGAALVYPYNNHLNECHAKDMPESDRWVYSMGVDIGFNDPTAFVVGCFRPGHPEIYVVHAEKHEHMIPSRVAAHIERLSRRFNIGQVVMDTGGIGKGYAEECSQRYDLKIEPARKTEKLAYIEMVRGEMLSGNIKVDPRGCEELIIEWHNLVWHETKSEPDSRFDDHLSDACLYMVRHLLPYYRPELVKQPLTPEEAVNQIAADHKQKLKRSLMTRKNRRKALRQVLAEARRGKPLW